jgi:hypothetical protein
MPTEYEGQERFSELPLGSVQAVRYLPIDKYEGKKHKYAISLDIGDPQGSQADVQLFIDGKLIRKVSIKEMMEGYFSI